MIYFWYFTKTTVQTYKQCTIRANVNHFCSYPTCNVLSINYSSHIIIAMWISSTFSNKTLYTYAIQSYMHIHNHKYWRGYRHLIINSHVPPGWYTNFFMIALSEVMTQGMNGPIQYTQHLLYFFWSSINLMRWSCVKPI